MAAGQKRSRNLSGIVKLLCVWIVSPTAVEAWFVAAAARCCSRDLEARPELLLLLKIV
jgi:hypothetical protein